MAAPLVAWGSCRAVTVLIHDRSLLSCVHVCGCLPSRCHARFCPPALLSFAGLCCRVLRPACSTLLVPPAAATAALAPSAPLPLDSPVRRLPCRVSCALDPPPWACVRGRVLLCGVRGRVLPCGAPLPCTHHSPRPPASAVPCALPAPLRALPLSRAGVARPVTALAAAPFRAAPSVLLCVRVRASRARARACSCVLVCPRGLLPPARAALLVPVPPLCPMCYLPARHVW